MAQMVDACGLSCPQPVILARNAIEAAEYPIVIQVETVTSRENVRRAAERLGCIVQVEQAGETFTLTLTK
jgi:TusA-related sulfurtransferase